MDEHKDFIEAGRIDAQVRDYAKGLIAPGASVLEITKKIEARIRELGAEIAFPPQVSINEQAAHNYPSYDDETVIPDDGVIKVDTGVHLDGAVADTAVSVDLGSYRDLVKATRDALDNALDLVAPGVNTAEIGRTIQETIKSHGYKPVANLSGHGLGRYVVHAPPSIPNISIPEGQELEEDMVVAIEPFATDGAGRVGEKGQAEVLMQQQHGRVRGRFTREVMKTIESYGALPFAKRWLVDKHGAARVAIALKELRQKDIVHEYPPLVDLHGGMVSQAEHTVIVKDKPIVTTKE